MAKHETGCHNSGLMSSRLLAIALIGWILGFAMADIAGKTGLKGVACGL